MEHSSHRTGDIASLEQSPCLCGHQGLRGATHIRKFKVIQEGVDHVVVQDRFSVHDKATLIGRLRLLLGNDVTVEVMPRSAIPRDRSGKLRDVES
jgi:hypothetical protein